MIGIVIVTHHGLGQSLLDCGSQILGRIDSACAVTIDANDDHAAALTRIRKAIEGLHADVGVLVLTDMFGGTPSNVSLSLLEPGRVEVVSGVNMPMLLHALTTRSRCESLMQLASSAAASARKNIVIAGELLGAVEQPSS